MDGESQVPSSKFLKASIGVTEYGCNGVKEEQNYVAGTGIVESFHSKNPFHPALYQKCVDHFHTRDRFHA